MNWKFVDNRPIYAQIVEEVQRRILSGLYPSGASLPSVRQLAEEANVNPNTMQKAMAELESQGLVHTQRTSGRTVSTDEELKMQLKTQIAGGYIEQYFEGMKSLGIERDAAIKMLTERKDDTITAIDADVNANASAGAGADAGAGAAATGAEATGAAGAAGADAGAAATGAAGAAGADAGAAATGAAGAGAGAAATGAAGAGAGAAGEASAGAAATPTATAATTATPTTAATAATTATPTAATPTPTTNPTKEVS